VEVSGEAEEGGAGSLIRWFLSARRCSLPQPSAGYPEPPLIQLRLTITTSAIPSSAPATPNPGDPWDGGWSVDEGAAAVRVEAGDMKAGCCAGIKQIHRKAREGRKDNVVSALRSLQYSSS